MHRYRGEGLVVVVTGASSGIGRATAHAFARRGAAVVLAARRAEMLAQVERECSAAGGAALAVPTDTSREEEVVELGRRAVQRFGRVDVWFNNAGVGVFGRFEDIPSEVWRRVVETNLFGYAHGARVALRQFRRQGGRGVLIQNASVVGRTSKPDSSAYAASKFAIRGFSEALRMEVLDEPGIRICTLLPSAIDTPFFHHAANFSGMRVRAAPPVYTPEEVAEAVVGLVERPRAELVVGGSGKVGVVLKPLLGGFGTRLAGRLLHRGFLADEPSPATAGNLFEPMRDGRDVRGGWRRGPNNGGVPTAAALAAAAALTLGLLARRRRREGAWAGPRRS